MSANELKTLTQLEALLNTTIPDFQWSGHINLRLERIRALVELLGDPRSRYPTVHVGGTSGKGTVAAMIASILSHDGKRTGLHLSPDVQTLTETWQLDGSYILPSRVLPVARHVTAAAQSVAATSILGPVSYFEIKVATAFQLFSDEHVDFGIVEVGLDGERDATNVIG